MIQWNLSQPSTNRRFVHSSRTLARSWTGSCAICAPSTASWTPCRASAQQHETLHEVCAALDKLGELGGARLFWGERAPELEGADHIRLARGRIEAFQKRLSEIEERRDALLDEIEQQERSGWFIEEDILEAQEQAERRAQEWTIEREVESFPFHTLVMPWTRGGEEDQRFRKALATSASSRPPAESVGSADRPPPGRAPEAARDAGADHAPDPGSSADAAAAGDRAAAGSRSRPTSSSPRRRRRSAARRKRPRRRRARREFSPSASSSPGSPTTSRSPDSARRRASVTRVRSRAARRNARW